MSNYFLIQFNKKNIYKIQSICNKCKKNINMNNKKFVHLTASYARVLTCEFIFFFYLLFLK